MKSAMQEGKSRQPPGSACLQCRSKKLRCDAMQPRCGTCTLSGVECIRPTTQSKRIQKRDHLKTLQTRIDVLEQELHDTRTNSISDILDMDFCLEEPLDMSRNCLSDTGPEIMTSSSTSLTTYLAPEENEQLKLTQEAGPFYFIEPQPDRAIHDLLCADLDQLYFERAHCFAPILHRDHYFSWAKLSTKTEGQICLQYAMWTLAASLSSQLQDIRESLYQHTYRLLECLELSDENLPSIEHIQARILILIYDFMKKSFHRGWISAGCCFRLIQLIRLHEVDVPRRYVDEDWIRQEEKRRTFWTAYSLDIFISIHGEWPLTLHEYANFTRLPAPENDFQSNHRVEMPYLSNVINSPGTSIFSPFTESIIFATIFKQVLENKQRSAIPKTGENNSRRGFWDDHNSLRQALKIRGEALLLKYPASLSHSDPILLFTKMVAQVAMLQLYRTMESVLCEIGDSQNTILTLKCESLIATREILSLSRSILSLSSLKVHPFTPFILVKCVDFLKTHHDLDESSWQHQVQQIHDLLRDMSKVNNIAKEYLSLSVLPGTHTSKD